MPIIYGDLCPVTNYLDLPVRCRCGWQYLQKGRAFVNGGILCPVGFEMGSIFFWSEGGCVVYTFNKKKWIVYLSRSRCSVIYSARLQLLIYHTWWFPGVQSSQSGINPPFSGKENQLIIYHSLGVVYNTQCDPNCSFIALGGLWGSVSI